ncbi:hypothetical protein OSB04_032114 [Centaurea solstitialis]|uniref:Maturase K n=1 Tax=Centaurea solstitialis TaxID=347529 RepID=A0AA38SN02_9ASTR|nr:hypothetical protein OSB04_032114 [Centaurea solstitialis]
MEHLAEVFARAFQANLWLFKDPFMHYVRYQGKSILASKGTFLLMNKWKYYFVNFWKSYFYLWSEPGRIYVNQLSNHSFDFLGYCSSVRLKRSMVRSQMLENAFLIDSAINKFDTIVPIMPLIGSLAKSKFCNALGHPIGKVIWGNLSDTKGQVLTRYSPVRHWKHHFPSDLHVLSMPPAFILSQDRTLHEIHSCITYSFLVRRQSGFGILSTVPIGNRIDYGFEP